MQSPPVEASGSVVSSIGPSGGSQERQRGQNCRSITGVGQLRRRRYGEL